MAEPTNDCWMDTSPAVGHPSSLHLLTEVLARLMIWLAYAMHPGTSISFVASASHISRVTPGPNGSVSSAASSSSTSSSAPNSASSVVNSTDPATTSFGLEDFMQFFENVKFNY